MATKEFVQQNKYKIFKTCVTYFNFLGLGGINTLVGSSLLDLQVKHQCSFETISQLVPARNIGYALGAASCGLLEKRFDDCLVLSLANLIAGTFLILAPWFHNLELMFTAVVISGFSQGVFDLYSNTLVLRIWKKDGVNWLQVLHMSFGVGALLAPIFTRPFLLPNMEMDDNDTLNSTIFNNSTSVIQYKPEDVRVQYAFLIVGGILCVITIPYFYCYLHDRKPKAKRVVRSTASNLSTISNLSNRSNRSGMIEHSSRTKKVIAILMCGFLANFQFGIENVVGNLGTAFAVKADIRMDKKMAVLIATVYWATFSFYRLIFIPLTFVFKESRLFIMNLGIILVGTFVLVPSAAYNEIATWISFVLLGIGYSPVFAISYGSLGKYFFVTNAMTSYIFVNGVIGGTIHATILSKYIENNPVIFTYYLGTMSVTYVVTSFALPVYLNKVFVKRKPVIRQDVQKY